MLKHFEKIELKSGESKEVQFTVTSGDMTFIGVNNLPTIEPGDFMVSIGNQNASFTLFSSCNF